MVIRLEANAVAPALAALREALAVSPAARFQHRLHCVVLVAAGHSGAELARLFGGDARTIQRWVERYRQDGVGGLNEGVPTGRPASLGAQRSAELAEALRLPPTTYGHAAGDWRSDVLRDEIVRRFGIALSTRHCQRLLRQLAQPGGGPSTAVSNEQPGRGCQNPPA